MEQMPQWIIKKKSERDKDAGEGTSAHDESARTKISEAGTGRGSKKERKKRF